MADRLFDPGGKVATVTGGHGDIAPGLAAGATNCIVGAVITAHGGRSVVG